MLFLFIKKSGSKFCVENYRPISLTSNVCKILESIIFDFICNHCKLNNIFIACQHGFRKGKSVVTNLLELLDDITDYLDNGNNVDLITIDFSKASDKISHNKLFCKLSKYGISGNLLAGLRIF